MIFLLIYAILFLYDYKGDYSMHILIVEDERALSDAIAQLLKDQHYEVDCVYDGRSGLDYARSAQSHHPRCHAAGNERV